MKANLVVLAVLSIFAAKTGAQPPAYNPPAGPAVNSPAPAAAAAAATPHTIDSQLLTIIQRVGGMPESQAPQSPEDQQIESMVASAVANAKGAGLPGARAALSSIFTTHPQAAASAHAMFEYARLQDQVPQIYASYANLLSRFPQSPWTTEACREIGKVASLDNNYSLALEGYRAFLRRRPQAAEARTLKMQEADCLRKLTRYEESIQAYQQILSGSRDFHEIARAEDGISVSLMALKRYDEALKQMEILVRRVIDSQTQPNPLVYENLAAVLLNEGLCLEELGRYESAVGRYRDVVKNYPERAEAELAQSRISDLTRPLLKTAPSAAPAAPAGQLNPITSAIGNPAERRPPAMSNRFETGATARGGAIVPQAPVPGTATPPSATPNTPVATPPAFGR